MLESMLLRGNIFNGGNGAGPSGLIAGTEELGYYGTFSNPIPEGTTLAAMIGLSVGTETNVGAPWFKFAIGGKTIMTPTKPMRSGISWKNLYDRGAVYGVEGSGPSNAGANVTQNRIVTIDGSQYRVRLFGGCDTEPGNSNYNVYNPAGTQNSEWTKLIGRICSDSPIVERWENLSNVNLGFATGVSVWCKERWAERDGTFHALKGYTTSGQRALGHGYASYTAQTGSWWPVLELIE